MTNNELLGEECMRLAFYPKNISNFFESIPEDIKLKYKNVEL